MRLVPKRLRTLLVPSDLIFSIGLLDALVRGERVGVWQRCCVNARKKGNLASIDSGWCYRSIRRFDLGLAFWLTSGWNSPSSSLHRWTTTLKLGFNRFVLFHILFGHKNNVLKDGDDELTGCVSNASIGACHNIDVTLHKNGKKNKNMG